MTSQPLSQEDVLAKIYRDLARLSGEIAIDRCRSRVLLQLVQERLKVPAEELDALFRKEIETHLEGMCHEITGPMLKELEEPEPLPAGGSCCMMREQTS